MAVAVLFTASCAKEDISSTIASGEVEVTFTANLQDLGTRAYGDGSQVKTLHYYVYDYPSNNELSDLNGTADRVDGKFKFSLPLLKGMKYNIVFWADCGTGSIYSYNPTAKTITANYNEVLANNESLDAFYKCVTNIDPTDATTLEEKTNVVLTRPFAQLNILTKDYAAINHNGVALEESKIVGVIPTTLNVLDGTIVNPTPTATVELVFNDIPADENDTDGLTPLSMNYILAPATQKFVADITVSYKGSIPFPSANYSNIPLQRNYKTNIIGNLLTASTDFTVTIESDFNKPDKDVIKTAADLQQQIANAPAGELTEIVLGGDIDLNDLFASLASTRAAATLPIVIPENKKIVLDLNGCTINVPFEDKNAGKHYYAFENHGTLTIKDTKGNGVIEARGNFNYGTMTLENGTIKAIDGNGGYGVRNYAGTFTMTGGTIATTYEDDNLVDKGGNDATPLRVDGDATATIIGGVLNNICDFTAAVENHGDLTINDGSFTTIHSTIANSGVMTINGGEFICNGKEGISSHCLYAPAGTTTINGGTFDGKDNNNGFNVYAAAGATVNITGGEFLPVHSGSLYGDGTITVSGGKFFDKIKDSRLAEGCKLEQEGDYWVVKITPAAKIGETPYYTLEEAVAAVKNGETIQLLRNVTLTEELQIPAGVVFNGNGKQINGTIYAGGNLTFVGHTKVTAFSASYYNRTITIGEGACLEVTGTGRVTFSYGNTFNITGSIENAKTADKSTIQPSLIIPAGISITGSGNDAVFNIKNAYVQIGSTSSKNSAANGTFTINIENSIAEFTNQLTFAEPTNGNNPTFNLNVENSVLTTGTKLILAAPNCNMKVDNSAITLATYFRNSGNVELKNGSILTGSTIQFGENGGHDGKTVVDNSTFTIAATSTGNPYDGRGTGSITAKNGATVTVDYYKDMTITTDATSTFNTKVQ